MQGYTLKGCRVVGFRLRVEASESMLDGVGAEAPCSYVVSTWPKKSSSIYHVVTWSLWEEH